MTWKLTAWGETRSPLSGVPWRELSDEEFAAAEAKFEPGALREQGYFELAGDEPLAESEGRRAKGRRRRQADAAAEAFEAALDDVGDVVSETTAQLGAMSEAINDESPGAAPAEEE